MFRVWLNLADFACCAAEVPAAAAPVEAPMSDAEAHALAARCAARAATAAQQRHHRFLPRMLVELRPKLADGRVQQPSTFLQCTATTRVEHLQQVRWCITPLAMSWSMAAHRTWA